MEQQQVIDKMKRLVDANATRESSQSQFADDKILINEQGIKDLKDDLEDLIKKIFFCSKD